eukprot:8908722-Karenia_brevis.AAC.1
MTRHVQKCRLMSGGTAFGHSKRVSQDSAGLQKKFGIPSDVTDGISSKDEVLDMLVHHFDGDLNVGAKVET